MKKEREKKGKVGKENRGEQKVPRGERKGAKKKAGRNKTGKRTVRHRGGGVKSRERKRNVERKGK